MARPSFFSVRFELNANLLADGSASTGTAFFCTFRVNESQNLPVLVTNKHVVKGARTGTFYLHEATKDDSGHVNLVPESFEVALSDFEKQWFMHPDPTVDLCVMPFEPLRRQAEGKGKLVFNCYLEDSLIPSQANLDDLGALEEVVMVGYPIGLWDSVNNFPILRRGVTATHPAVNFMGRQQGIVDMACFPGSSGSPILIMNEGSFATPNGGLVMGTRIYLLGVLFAGPVHRADGRIEVAEIPTHSVVTSVTNIPIHLGYYVKASALTNLKKALLEHIKP